MKLLGIDYGLRKIGISLGDTDSKFAEPLFVVKYEDEAKVLEKIDQLAKVERVDKVVVGISEGKMAQTTKEFARKLAGKLNLPIEFQDETLSTRDAEILSIEAGIKRKKRKNREDAFAAAIMLQGYLEK